MAGQAARLSVVIPVRDGERFLAEAIASVRSQGHGDLELLVVDDGSTDGTAAVARRFDDVRYIRQDHAGPAAARNTGIRAATGALLGFVDADDLWTDGRLGAMLAPLADDAVDVVLGRSRRIAMDARDAGAASETVFPFSIGAALYRRRAFDRVGLFDESLRFGEDQDWFLRAREAGIALVVIDEVVEVKRKHAASTTRGKTLVDLNLPRILKLSLDRRRAVSSPAHEWFDRAGAQFGRAAGGCGGSVDRWYEIGGYPVRLCFAGSGLLDRLTPALAHLAIAPRAEASFTVRLWDDASTGTTMLPPPWGRDAYLQRGVIRGYNDTRFATVFNLADRALRMLDRERDVALFWTPDARTLAYWEASAPLRTILHWWMRDHGRQLVHGAAVGTAAGGVLLAGRGGVGKSSAALACLGSTLAFAGDDYVLLEASASGDVAYVHSLYATAKLAGDNLHRFPQLAPLVANADRLAAEKGVIPLYDHARAALTRGFPLRALLLPRIAAGGETTITPASAAEALAALAPTTVFQLPGEADAALDTLASVARAVPAFHLHLGADLARVPIVIADLLASVRSAGIASAGPGVA